MTRRVAVLTGSRGEWGYLRPVLRAMDAADGVEAAIIATNMHLVPTFGSTVHEIERDGFEVAARLPMTLDGYTGETMAKSLGVLLVELPGVLVRLQPDILLLAGDRGEQMIGALAAVHLGLPVAHIQAGELSGNVDGLVRHAITKLAHVHFCANEEFAARVCALGEQPERVHLTGAPLVDEIVTGEVTPAAELATRFDLGGDDGYLLAVVHPVTEEEQAAGAHADEVLHALADTPHTVHVVLPNSDAGSEAVRAVLAARTRPGLHLHRNLPRADYLGLLAGARALVGNSSSGIMEAPSFGTPAVNVGRRQRGRLRAANVLDVEVDRTAIAEAIAVALTPEMRARAASGSNPYGDGAAAPRIVEVLRDLVLDDALLRKEMTY